ncbi:MAG TPA: PspA/IM30 family protein, partial [Oligoflexia bacterium]|nr:PspA/IM30 family protein [Oligoflexia bacterium]
MTLYKRIKRLFQADMHEILDCIEDPEAAVKQALREMTAEAEKDEQTLEELRQGAERLAGEQKSKTETIAETEKQIDAAFLANEENLARTFIKRKLIASRRVLECQRELEQNALEAKRIAERL